jgi:phage virion morphogenesis protein
MPQGYDISDFVRKMDNLKRIYARIPDRAATIAIAFSKDRFREQAWVDNTTQPWKPRKENAAQRRRSQGRGILTKSARLKRSIRKLRVGPYSAIIGTDVPYASVHNYGYKGSVNARSKKGKSFSRNVNMPARQFMGNSAVLAKRIERDMTAQIITGLKS